MPCLLSWYLGAIIVSRISLGVHIETIAAKTRNMINASGRLTSADPARRREDFSSQLFSNSKLFYGSSVRAESGDDHNLQLGYANETPTIGHFKNNKMLSNRLIWDSDAYSGTSPAEFLACERRARLWARSKDAVPCEKSSIEVEELRVVLNTWTERQSSESEKAAYPTPHDTEFRPTASMTKQIRGII